MQTPEVHLEALGQGVLGSHNAGGMAPWLRVWLTLKKD